MKTAEDLDALQRQLGELATALGGLTPSTIRPVYLRRIKDAESRFQLEPAERELLLKAVTPRLSEDEMLGIVWIGVRWHRVQRAFRELEAWLDHCDDIATSHAPEDELAMAIGDAAASKARWSALRAMEWGYLVDVWEAEICDARGERQRAITHARRAIQRASTTGGAGTPDVGPRALLVRLQLLEQESRSPSTRNQELNTALASEMTELVDLDPEDAGFLMLSARCQLVLGHFQEARRLAQIVLDMAPAGSSTHARRLRDVQAMALRADLEQSARDLEIRLQTSEERLEGATRSEMMTLGLFAAVISLLGGAVLGATQSAGGRYDSHVVTSVLAASAAMVIATFTVIFCVIRPPRTRADWLSFAIGLLVSVVFAGVSWLVAP